eukprot:s103_g53.t1
MCSRELELLSIKADKQVVMLEGHQLQVKAKGTELTSELGNELRVHQAMIRRGLALEMSNLGTYAAHEKVMREFMSHLNRSAPPGYKSATIDAIMRADKELWTRVADQVRSDLRADKNGDLPVDKALEELHTTPSVAFHLLPLPVGASSNAASNPNNANKRKTADDDEKPTKVQPKAQPKRKIRDKQGRTNLPAGLHGYSGWNKQKQRICYNFNMPHGCSNNVTKENNFDKCSRGMHQCIKSVLAGKKFELMRCALEAVRYPDASIAAEASAGLPLVGWMKQSGMFASNLRPPEASSDAELDREVWDATMAEVKGGTLDGPFELDSLPRGHVVSPRFGIRQGHKVRPIDNLTASGINSTVGLPERLQVDTIDEVAAMVKRCTQVHGPGCRLVGRTFDLRKAYRQLGVSENHYKFSWIAVWSPEHERVQLFRMKGLPFGGTASVASFLRVSRALKELGIRGGALMWSSFFDDFICISRPEDAESADMTIRFLFRSLGWILSEDPDKDVGFASVFTALGVEFDLTNVGSGILRIGNTSKRREELSGLVRGFLDADAITCSESESLRSRLTFAEGQIFGRSAKLALRAVGGPARVGRDCSPLSEDVKFGLQWMLDRIVNAPPRVISTAHEPHYLLFVDGACEPESDGDTNLVTSVGAILIDASGAGLKYFGLRLPSEVTSVWAGDGRKQLVFEAEILPYLLALACWGDILSGRHVLVFIDNDGARHSWIRGGADSVHALRMIHKGTLVETRMEVCPYFCRVPTMSNIADGPSRLDFRPDVAPRIVPRLFEKNEWRRFSNTCADVMLHVISRFMMRIFGKSCACNCSGSERPEPAPDVPIDTQQYRSYKEQVLHVGRPTALTVTRQSEEAIFEVVAPSDVEDPRTRPCGPGALCSLTVVVQESSIYVRVLCVLSAVALVLLSSLGPLAEPESWWMI